MIVIGECTHIESRDISSVSIVLVRSAGSIGELAVSVQVSPKHTVQTLTDDDGIG